MKEPATVLTNGIGAAGTGDVFSKVSGPMMDLYRAFVGDSAMPFYRPIEGEVGPRIDFEGRSMIMLGSNNYLGLTSEPRVRAAAVAAVERFGTGMTGSRLLNGTLPIHLELESLLADWVGKKSALVFSTGYAVNLGAISSLVQAGDTLLADSAAHASIVDGGRFCEGALRAFRHNRPNSLRRGLQSLQSQSRGGVLVAIDGIYSMEGDWAPVPEIHAISKQFGARLLVDEAHALGVVGPRGAGTCAELDIDADLIMGTFSKALASCGGFIAGSPDVIDFLRMTCRPLMFTAAGVPAATAAALEAAKIAQEEDWRRETVLARANQLRSGLMGLGYDVGEKNDSPIVPVHAEDSWTAGVLWRALLDRDVYTNCAIPPAVPLPILRTSVMATHSEADIDEALLAFEAALSASA